MTVRQANINDIDKVITLFKTTLTEILYYNDIAKQTELLHYSYDNLIQKLIDDPFSIIVYEIENNIAGFCFNRFDDYTIWLEWIITDNKFRKQGIGNFMLEKLTEFSLKRNCHKIWCDCRTSNQISKNFLEMNGFKFITEIKYHWYKQDFNLFEKIIG